MRHSTPSLVPAQTPFEPSAASATTLTSGSAGNSTSVSLGDLGSWKRRSPCEHPTQHAPSRVLSNAFTSGYRRGKSATLTWLNPLLRDSYKPSPFLPAQIIPGAISANPCTAP